MLRGRLMRMNMPVWLRRRLLESAWHGQLPGSLRQPAILSRAGLAPTVPMPRGSRESRLGLQLRGKGTCYVSFPWQPCWRNLLPTTILRILPASGGTPLNMMQNRVQTPWSVISPVCAQRPTPPRLLQLPGTTKRTGIRSTLVWRAPRCS